MKHSHQQLMLRLALLNTFKFLEPEMRRIFSPIYVKCLPIAFRITHRNTKLMGSVADGSY
ncbi:MAG TPA: hypothetical protein VK175_01265 [Leadbetterella sp.]|nr:hypothetical protein [Leadbetterella sp.]